MGVNPENGVMDKEEPLKTLKSYDEIHYLHRAHG